MKNRVFAACVLIAAFLVSATSAFAASTTIVTSFSGPSSTSTYPPHNALCVGPSNVVTIAGTQIEWTNLTGGSPVVTSTYTFFSSLHPTGGLYDQRCAYDAVNRRYVVAMVHGAGSASAMFFAVSKDSNPNNGWWFAALNQPIPDRPSLAVDGSNIYVTATQYDASGSNNLGTSVWVIGSTAGSGGGIYNGGTLTVVANELLPPSQGPYYVTADGSGKAYLAATWSNGAQMVLGLQAYDAASNTFGVTSTIGLGAIDQGVANVAQQQGTTIQIDAGDKRVAGLAYSNNVLWGVSTMTPPGSNVPLVHWFQLGVSNPAAPVLLDQGDISGSSIGSSVATFNPSIAADSAGNVIVNFAVSSSSIFPANYSAARSAADSVFGPPAPFQTSGGYYNDGSGSLQRWGLNSSALADPNNAASFWISNEYASASHWWQTSVAQVAVGAGTTPTAALSASPTSIASGQSSTLTWSSTNATSCTGNGFSTGGATSGTASVSPATTTNYTMTCSGTGGASNLASATVTVTTGGVSMRFDFNAGASGPTATGYTGVPLVAYSATLGYGWQSIAAMDARNRTDVASLVGSLGQDFHKSTGASGAYDNSFLIDLPNGGYSVTVYLGDGDEALTNQYVDAQGTNVVGPISTTSCSTSVTTCSRSFTFPASVTNGQLKLRFYTTNATSVYYGYFAVEGIDIAAGP